MTYPHPKLTADQRDLVTPFVTNLDGPVFALTNLPDTAKAAMFGRYSRYAGTLRELMADEFAELLEQAPATQIARLQTSLRDLQGRSSGRYAGTRIDLGASTVDALLAADATAEDARTKAFMDRVVTQYGDDSVAQLGGAHLACEWVSNIMTKLLQRPRLGSYLEQSTRYIDFSAPVEFSDGDQRYRVYADDTLPFDSQVALGRLFEIYTDLLGQMTEWAKEKYPRRNDEDVAPWERACKAKALDLVRGLLPAATLSHMGVYASGQTYEQIVLHLLAHPLPEAQRYGQMILTELDKVIPSFLGRVHREDRGGVWVEYLQRRRDVGERWTRHLGVGSHRNDGEEPFSVQMTRARGSIDEVREALLFESATVSGFEIDAAINDLDTTDAMRLAMDDAFFGERADRRHRPGRGLEAMSFRFEIVSDYGAFRDLQRHRMLTCQWQAPTADLGADVPPEVEEAGCGDEYRRALGISANAYADLRDAGHPGASLAVCLAYRMRYVLDLNAREAMQLCELRSGAGGHASYRSIAIEMARQIEAACPEIGRAMTHIDTSGDERLGRLTSELRLHARQRDAH